MVKRVIWRREDNIMVKRVIWRWEDNIMVKRVKTGRQYNGHRLQITLLTIILSSLFWPLYCLHSFDHYIVFPSSDYSFNHYIVFPSSDYSFNHYIIFDNIMVKRVIWRREDNIMVKRVIWRREDNIMVKRGKTGRQYNGQRGKTGRQYNLSVFRLFFWPLYCLPSFDHYFVFTLLTIILSSRLQFTLLTITYGEKSNLKTGRQCNG
jgi:hypothetical protein